MDTVKNTLRITTLVVLSLLSLACKGGGRESGNLLMSFLLIGAAGPILNEGLNVDLRQTKSLLRTNASSSTASVSGNGEEFALSPSSAGGEGSLYVIDNSNYIESVQLFSDDVSYTAYYIADLQNYIVFSLSDEAPCNLVVARKADSALFCAAGIENGLRFVPNGFFYGSSSSVKDYTRDFREDSAGNLYLNGVLAGPRDAIYSLSAKLYKLDLAEAEDLQINLVFDGTAYGSINKFRVHPTSGDIMIDITDSDGYPHFYFRFASGTIREISSLAASVWGGGSNAGTMYADTNYVNWDLSPDHTFYVLGGRSSPPAYSNVGTPELISRFFLLNPNPTSETVSALSNNNVMFDLVTEDGLNNDWSRSTGMDTFSSSENNRCSAGSFVYWGAWGDPSLTRYNTATPVGAVVDLRASSIGAPIKILCNNSQVYIHGKASSTHDRILLFNESDVDLVHPTLIDLIPAGYNYTIRDMSLQADGKLLIGAIDNDTGNNLVAEVDPASPGTVNVLSTSAPEVTQVVPVDL